MKNILLISGPNLNLLEKRENSHYPQTKLLDVVNECKSHAKQFDIIITHFQSNHEGAIIDKIHEAITNDEFESIMINAGAYSHTSIAILDALNIYRGIVIEIHFSDIEKREKFRQHSFISLRANKLFKGEGFKSYIKAIDYLRGI
jgi:3-dehydroquinate dehydratase II